MVDGDWDSLWVGIVAAITLFALNLLFKNLVYKSSQFNKLIEGEPVLLIYHGKMVIENIRKEQITQNELEGAIRENGFENITEVSLAKLKRMATSVWWDLRMRRALCSGRRNRMCRRG